MTTTCASEHLQIYKNNNHNSSRSWLRMRGKHRMAIWQDDKSHPNDRQTTGLFYKRIARLEASAPVCTHWCFAWRSSTVLFTSRRSITAYKQGKTPDASQLVYRYRLTLVMVGHHSTPAYTLHDSIRNGLSVHTLYINSSGPLCAHCCHLAGFKAAKYNVYWCRISKWQLLSEWVMSSWCVRRAIHAL